MINFEPQHPVISKIIHPNLSTWQTIEISYNCAKYAIDNNIPGDFVECGIADGNNLGAMCYAGRYGFGFDSFEGIPWAGEKDTEQPGIGAIDKSKVGILESSGVSSYSMENVESNFERWGLKNVTLIKGWFQNSVRSFINNPPSDFPVIKEISVLRLDGDLYDSTIVCLDYLYPKLSEGGILIIDDWNLAGCVRAFEDYFKDRSHPRFLHDNGRTYWMK